MGDAGRIAGSRAARAAELFHQWLLERMPAGGGRGADAGRAAPDSAWGTKTPRGDHGDWIIYSRQHSTLRRISAERRSGDCIVGVDVWDEWATGADFAGQNCVAAGSNPGSTCRMDRLLLLPRDGKSFSLAYDVNRETYAMGRYFVWQKPWPQKTYHHAKMEAKYEQELRDVKENQTLRGFVRRAGEKLSSFWRVYLIAPLPFVLIALPCAARDRRLRVPWMIGGIFVVGLAIEVWFLPHYFAPATALLYLFLMQCMRHLRWFEWRKRPVGLAFVRAVTAVYVATVILRIGMAVTLVHPEKEWRHGDLDRANLVRELDAQPGQHVVLVKYAADFDLDREWVFNGADIDGQKIVWARDMGAEKNQELLEYYRGRKFWKVEADGDARVEPYVEK